MSIMTDLTKEDRRVAFKIMDIIDKNIKAQPNIGYTDITLNLAKKEAMEHHVKFIKELNVTQNKVDAYKIGSWYGFYLSKYLNDPERRALSITLSVMNAFLGAEIGGKKLSREFVTHLHVMTKNDCANDGEFGVGKNGIYSTFSACKDLIKQTAV